ncbi:MAG TPA: MgtC/SapB family protein [Actinomycetota bacterium]|nr:MgtC/SapB family protein [Actinomycetota bacterium]
MDARLQLALFGRIALGALLGYLIGFEREFRGKIAGERTFALLSLGAASFVGMGILLFPISGDRVVQGVATGIGLLCAGVIFSRRAGPPHGLTTAAAAWAAAIVGVLSGAALYLTAILTTALTIGILEAEHFSVRRRRNHVVPPAPPVV